MKALDVSGVTFPGPPGQGVDHLLSLWGNRVAEAARALWAAAPKDPIATRCLQALGTAPRSSLPRIFVHPLASFDAAIAPSNDVPDDRSPPRRRVALSRHLIGAPDIGELTLVLTGRDVPDALIFPHLGVRLKTPGDRVVSIRQTGGRVQIVRDDGLSATFRAGRRAPDGVNHPLLTSVPRVGPFDMLNAEPSVSRALANFRLAVGPDLSAAMARLADGFAVLSATWPMAADAMARHVRGVVLLETRKFERSHAPAALCGTIIMTAGAPVTVGDILCHEASHVRMHFLKAVDDLFAARSPAEEAAGFDSPWRPDKRPLDGLVLGVHAFLNVCGWYARVARRTGGRDHEFARRIRDRQAANVRKGWALLEAKGFPTESGQAIAAEFMAAVDALPMLREVAEIDG